MIRRKRSRLEICRRDIQPFILAHGGHDLFGVDAEAGGERTDLVCKPYLHRVKGVAGVLDHFGGAQGDDGGLARQAGVQVSHKERGIVRASADHQQEVP